MFYFFFNLCLKKEPDKQKETEMSNSWQLTPELLEDAKQKGVFYVVTQETHDKDVKGKKKGEAKGKIGKVASVSKLQGSNTNELPKYYRKGDHNEFVWDVYHRLVGTEEDVKKVIKKFKKNLSPKQLKVYSKNVTELQITLDNYAEEDSQAAISALLAGLEPVYDFTVGQILLLGRVGTIVTNTKNRTVELVDDPDYVTRGGVKRTIYEKVLAKAKKNEKDGDNRAYRGSAITEHGDEDVSKALRTYPQDDLKGRGLVRVKLAVTDEEDNTEYPIWIYASNKKDITAFLEMDEQLGRNVTAAVGEDKIKSLKKKVEAEAEAEEKKKPKKKAQKKGKKAAPKKKAGKKARK